MRQDFTATSGTVNGMDAMVGPYATFALGDIFYLDVSGAWGMSHSEITPVGTCTDSFWSSRVMLDASFVGQFSIDDWTFRATMSDSYIGEETQPYTAATDAPILSRISSSAKVSFAPRIFHSFELENGATLTPWAEAAGNFAVQTAGSVTAGSYASEHTACPAA